MKRTIIIALSVVALVFGVISYASAETDSGPNNTVVKADLQGVFELTTVQATAHLGTIDPETPGSATVAVGYKSNFPATLTATVLDDGDFTTLTSSIGAEGVTARGNKTVNDEITGAVDWDVNPDTAVLEGTIQYTLTR